MAVGSLETPGSASLPPAADADLETLLGLPAAPHRSEGDAAFLTLDDVCARSAAQELSGSVAKSRVRFMVDGATYRDAWFGLTAFLREAMADAASSGRAVRVATMATMTHRCYAMGIRVPTFVLHARYKRKYGLAQDSAVDARRGATAALCAAHACELDSARIGELCGLDADVALFAVESVLGTMGLLAAAGAPVRVHFGVGELVIADQSARFTFTQQAPERPRRPGAGTASKTASNPRLLPRRMRLVQGAAAAAASPNARVLGRFVDIAATEVDADDDAEAQAAEAAAFGRALESLPRPTLAASHTEADYRAAMEAFSNSPRKAAPPLLDAHSRLRAATFSDATASASARIGAHYNAPVQNGRGPAALSPRAQAAEAAEKTAVAADEAAVPCAAAFEAYPAADAALYAHYAAHGVPSDVVEPASDAMVRAFLERVAPRVPPGTVLPWPGGDAPTVEDVAVMESVAASSPMSVMSPYFPDDAPAAVSTSVRRIMELLRQRHAVSIQKATLDYVLLSAPERQRLGLVHGAPPELRVRPERLPQKPPAAWRNNISKAKRVLQHRLVITTKPFIECHRLWQDFHDVLLVKLPATAQVPAFEARPKRTAVLGGGAAVTVDDFVVEQLKRVDEVTALLRSEWHPKLARAFFAAIEDGTLKLGGDGDVDESAYFNAAALIMGSQLNHIVRGSIAALVDFFEAFTPGHLATAPAAFLVKPDVLADVSNPCISFERQSAHLRDAVERVFDRVARAFEGFERVEVWQRQIWDDGGEQPASAAPRASAVNDGRRSANSATKRTALPQRSTTSAQALHDDETAVSTWTSGKIVSKGGKQKRNFLVAIEADDALLLSARKRILYVVQANLAVAKANVDLYAPFAFLLEAAPVAPQQRDDDEDDDETYGASRSQGPRSQGPDKLQRARGADVVADLSALEVQISDLWAAARGVCVSQHFAAAPLLEVGVLAVHATLVDRALARSRRLLEGVQAVVAGDVRGLTKRARVTVLWLQRRPASVDELVAAQRNLLTAETRDLGDFADAQSDVQRRVAFLVRHNGLTMDVLSQAQAGHQAVAEVRDQVAKGPKQLALAKRSVEADLAKRSAALAVELSNVAKAVSAFSDRGNPKMIREYMEQLREVRRGVDRAAEEAQLFNAEETKLGLEKVTFFSLSDIFAELEPYEQLWATALQFHLVFSTWVKGPIRALDGDEAASAHAEMSKTFDALVEKLQAADASEPHKFALSIQAQLDRFAPNVPIIRALSSKHLTEAHWREISAVFGFQLNSESITNLTNLLELSENRPGKAEMLDDIAKRAKLEALGEPEPAPKAAADTAADTAEPAAEPAVDPAADRPGDAP